MYRETSLLQRSNMSIEKDGLRSGKPKESAMSESREASTQLSVKIFTHPVKTFCLTESARSATILKVVSSEIHHKRRTA